MDEQVTKRATPIVHHFVAKRVNGPAIEPHKPGLQALKVRPMGTKEFSFNPLPSKGYYNYQQRVL